MSSSYSEIREKYFRRKIDRAHSGDLEKCFEVQTWLKTVSPSTRKGYLIALKKFCGFCGKSPRQLILERDSEIKNSEPNSRTGVRDLVLDFRECLEKEGYAPKTINTWDGTVRSFFTAVLGVYNSVEYRFPACMK